MEIAKGAAVPWFIFDNLSRITIMESSRETFVVFEQGTDAFGWTTSGESSLVQGLCLTIGQAKFVLSVEA